MLSVLDGTLAHAKLFLDILSIRFPGKFRVECDIPEDLTKLYCLRFVLQPLVENCVSHGFGTMDTGGIIRITSSILGEELRIYVEDNGCGIGTDRLEELRWQLQGEVGTSSVGLFNVHNRIRLRFGPGYGVELENIKTGGVRAIVRQPVQRSPLDTEIKSRFDPCPL